MTKSEENRFTMISELESVLSVNEDLVNTRPAFAASKTELTEKINAIEQEDSRYSSVMSGKTSTKKNRKEELVKAVLVVTAGLYVYGVDAKDNEIIEIAKVAKSELSKMRDTLLPVKALTIKQKAEGVLNELTNYGVEQAEIDALTEAMSNYNEAFDKKGSAFADKGASRGSLKALFDEAEFIIKEKMDKLIVQFQESHPVFYSQYWNARVIRDLGEGRRVSEPPAPVES